MHKFFTILLLSLSFMFVEVSFAGGDDRDKGPVETLDNIKKSAPVTSKKVSTKVKEEAKPMAMKPASKESKVLDSASKKAVDAVKATKVKKVSTTPEIIKNTPLEKIYETCEDIYDGESGVLRYTCAIILTTFAVL